MSLKTLFATFLCFSWFLSYSQNSTGDLYKEARDFENNGAYEEALEVYLTIQEKKSGFKDTNYRIEILNLALGKEREKGLEELESLRQSEGSDDKNYELMLGKIYENRYEFEKAIDSYESFLYSAFNISDKK